VKSAQTRTYIFSLLVVATSLLLTTPSFADGDDPPGRVARLSQITGSVSFEPAGEDQWSQASLNYPLTTGDRVYTDRDGRAELETGNIAIRISSSTDLTAANMSDQLLQLGLAQGTLRVRVYEMQDGHSVEIDTANVSLTLLRAGNYRVETYPDDNTTYVYVISGDLEVSGNGLSQTVHTGQALKITGTDDVESEWVSPPRSDDFDNWCADRDHRFQDSRSRQYVSTHTPGYSDLDQYGRWDPDPDYGQVWYPSTVSVGWAPYRYGRWVWIEPWGWTWVAEEPWGFTPFHYGRWAFIRSRWGWCPGPVAVRPVYAPALVAFVGGPRAGISVWFPLGPRDPYYPWYHHSDNYLRQVNVTNVSVRNVTVINNYINVRNVKVTNVHYEYQRIAPTAVSTDAMRNARPVGREMVRLNPDEINRSRVVNHPEVAPNVRAIHAGAPEVHPPVVQDRPRFEQRKAGGDNRPVVNNPPGNEPGNQTGNQGGNRDNSWNRSRDNRPDTRGQNPPQGQTDRGNVRVPMIANPPAQGQPLPGNEHRVPMPGNQTPGSQPQGGNPRANNPPPANNPPANTGQPAQNQPGNRDEGRGKPPDRGVFPITNPPSVVNPPNTAQPPADQGNRDSGRGRQPERTNNPPVTNAPVVNNQPPNTGQPAQNQPGNRDRGRGEDFSTRPAQPPRVVTNNPPPPQTPKFEQRQPALQEHPGRPLEPKQMDNVRQGQPAGAAQDREYPPHASPRTNQGPPPNQGGNKPDNKSDKKPDDKDKKH